MNVLFLSQVLPYPLDAGPKIRSYYVLKHLTQSHRVTLVTFIRKSDSAEAVAHLESFCHAVRTVPIQRSRSRDLIHLAASILKRRPFLILRDDLRAMDESLRAVTQAFTVDAVHADQLSMAHYALRIPRVRRVLDQHNAVWTIAQRLADNESSVVKRFGLQREARLMRAYEAQTCAQFDQVVTVTAEDKHALTFPELPPKAPLETIPICIDPGALEPIPFNDSARDLLCVGGMFYPPNVDGMVWFARQVLPIIWQESPETRFYIVGARPAQVLLALARAEPRIVVTGYAQNADEYFARAAAFVVPMRAGGGMRVKILDTWARGVPMVSTTIGSEGIAIRPDENLLVGDTPREFAQAALRLIQDREFARCIAARGRMWVEAQYNWRKIYRTWDSIYSRLTIV
jgi:glycosyltransferase involved in cell wall biosynthesis